MRGMFQNAKKLVSINMGNLNLSNVTDIYDMFNGCISLMDINLDNTTMAINSMEMMLMTNLKNIYATEGKWVVPNVSGNMFYDCGTSSVTYI